QNLNKCGVETIIAATNAGFSEDEFSINNEIEYKQVKIIFFPLEFSEAYKYSSKLEKWLKKSVSNYDIVHIHAVFSHSSLAASKACINSKVPYVLRPLGSLDPWSLKQRKLLKKILFKFGVLKMINSASMIHYTSDSEKELAEKKINNTKGFVIPLSVDQSFLEYNNEQSVLKKHDESSYILFLSRIHHKKGIGLLISAFLKLKEDKKFSDLRFIIAGDGEKEYVRKIKNTASENGDIIFTGWLNEEEKKSALYNAKLLVLPSYQENFGLCLIESMAMGVPVLISRNVNLYEDIIAGEAGWVCEMDQDSIHNSLKDILNNDEMRKEFGINGKKLVENNYTNKVVTQKLMKIYNSIL
ncbi:MAG: glycosyltransferase, partial [Thermodesulfobacteriota bacterium]